MQVLEHQNERGPPRRHLDGRAPGGKEGGPVDDLGSPAPIVAARRSAAHARAIRRRGLKPPESPRARPRRLFLQADEADQQGAQRPVGDPLAVRETLRDRHRCIGRECGQPMQELLDQAGLPGAGGRDEAHEEWAAIGEGPTGDQLELRQVVVPADERSGTAPPRPPARGGAAPGPAAACPSRRSRSGAQGEPVPSSPGGPLAAQDGPRLGRLLQARGDVHGVAGDQEVARMLSRVATTSPVFSRFAPAAGDRASDPPGRGRGSRAPPTSRAAHRHRAPGEARRPPSRRRR